MNTSGVFLVTAALWRRGETRDAKKSCWSDDMQYWYGVLRVISVFYYRVKSMNFNTAKDRLVQFLIWVNNQARYHHLRPQRETARPEAQSCGPIDPKAARKHADSKTVSTPGLWRVTVCGNQILSPQTLHIQLPSCHKTTRSNLLRRADSHE